MKIEILQEKFAQMLIHINKAVSNKPNLPVLTNVLLSAEKGELMLASTDLEIGITAKIGAEIEKPGSVTVSAKLLSEFVNSIKPGKLTLNLDGQKLVINSVDNSAEFFIIPAEDFPSVPKAEGEPIIKINAPLLSKALEKTTFAAAHDNSRPVLTGIQTTISKRKVTFIGVDSFRLSRKEIKIENGPENDFTQIIPAKALDEVNKIIKDLMTDKEEVEIYSLNDNNQMIFKIGEVELATRLIEGEFPLVDSIIPKEYNYKFDVLKTELQSAIKVVNIFARNTIGNKTRYFIDSENSKLVLKAAVVDVGTNKTEVDIANLEGGDIETSYNAKFLQDMINSIESDEIIYETEGTTSPGLFRDKKDGDYIHIIMPMRLD